MREKTSVQIDADLWKAFRKRCVDLGIKQQDGWESALSAWLGAFKDGEPGPVIQRSPRPNQTDRWHALLSTILASGDSEIIRAIQNNLLAFSHALDLQHPKKSDKGARSA